MLYIFPLCRYHLEFQLVPDCCSRHRRVFDEHHYIDRYRYRSHCEPLAEMRLFVFEFLNDLENLTAAICTSSKLSCQLGGDGLFMRSHEGIRVGHLFFEMLLSKGSLRLSQAKATELGRRSPAALRFGSSWLPAASRGPAGRPGSNKLCTAGAPHFQDCGWSGLRRLVLQTETTESGFIRVGANCGGIVLGADCRQFCLATPRASQKSKLVGQVLDWFWFEKAEHLDYRIGHVFAIVASAGRTFFEFWPHLHKSIIGNAREGIFFCLLLGNAQAKSTLSLRKNQHVVQGFPQR